MKNNFLLYFSSKIIKGIAPFIFLPLILSQIDSASYGEFSYYEAIVMIISQVILFGSHQFISDHFNTRSAKELLTKSGQFILINTIVIIAILLICSVYFKSSLDILLIGVGGGLFAISLSYLNFLKLSGLAKKVLVFESVTVILRYLIPLILIYFYFIDGELSLIVGFIVSLVIFNVLSFIRLQLNMNKTVETMTEKLNFSDFYRTGKTIFIYSISAYLISFSDRIMLEHMIGSSELGVYTLGYKIASVIQVLILAYVSAWLPKLYRREVNVGEIITKKALGFGLGAVFAVSASSYFYIKLFYSAEFSQAFLVTCIVSIAFFFFGLSSIGYHFLCLKGLHKKIAIWGMMSALLNIGFNYFMIPSLGVTGAALATLISYLFLALCFIRETSRAN